MRFHHALPTAAVGLFLIAALSSSADAAESYAPVGNGTSFEGDVPSGTDIRIEFQLAAGAEPRLSVTLTPAGGAAQVTFVEEHLFGPDGVEIEIPVGAVKVDYRHGKSKLALADLTAPLTGNYQFLLKTNSVHAVSHVTGKFASFRPSKIPVIGDDASIPPANPIVISLLAQETVTLSLKRVSGTPPMITLFDSPFGVSTALPQKTSKKGTATRYAQGGRSGDYSFTIGYQSGTPVGAWKGTLKVKSPKAGGRVFLRLRNSPGVALSVFDNDFTLVPTFGGSGIGVATDDNPNNPVILVTSEGGGALLGQFFDAQLAPIPGQTTPTQLMTSASDFAPGETLSGHRTMFAGGSYYVAASTASGLGLSIAQANTALQVGHRAQVLNNSAASTRDFFMAGDGTKVSLGVAYPASKTHAVYVLDGSNLALVSTVAIGGFGLPQSAGSGAAWRGVTDAVYEMWTPDTLDYHGPSDLHRVLFASDWTPSTTDAKPVNSPTDVETMPTAVTVDDATGVTVVHYVVADDPPLGNPGSGRIHRRLFDRNGVEIPGSHAVLPRASCNRPVSTIRANYLYVGYESSTGPIVDRYQLLR